MSQQFIGYFLKTINDKLKVKAEEELKICELTFAQSRILGFLKHNEGQATQKEIEVFLEVSHPTVVGLVTRMEHKGYVECRVDINNRRNKVVSMTEKAKALGDEMERHVTENEKKLMRGLSESEIKELNRMLGIIYKNLEE